MLTRARAHNSRPHWTAARPAQPSEPGAELVADSNVDKRNLTLAAEPIDAHSSAAAGAFGSESKYAAQASVDIVHEGSRKLAGLGVKVALVEGDQGGYVDDGVFGQPRRRRRQEDVAWHAARPVLDVMTAAMVVFRRLALNGPDWMTRTGRHLAGLLPRVSPGSAHQMLPRWITSRPGGPGGCARLQRQLLLSRQVLLPGALRRFAG